MKSTTKIREIIRQRLRPYPSSRPVLFAEPSFPGAPEQHPAASNPGASAATGPDETAAADVLPAVIKSLTGFIDESESDFMLLGIGLRSVHSNVTELTDLMLGTVKQVTAEEEGGFLEQGRQILKASLAEIRDYHDGVRCDLERINSVLADLENLSTTSKQIKQFARSLKTVALIMLVENGRAFDDSVDIFSGVAREIKDLSMAITTIANDVYRHVEKAREMHRVSREEISARIRRLETLTSEIEATVQQSAHETEMLLQLSVDAVERAGRRSHDISLQVAEIVVGVQFHDNMKQRIARIIDILKAVAGAVYTDGQAGEGVPAAQVLREQAGLLEAINGEVRSIFEKNRAALKGIEKEVSSLIMGLEDMGSDDRLDDAIVMMQDPFSHLQDTLTQLHGLLDRGKVLFDQIRTTAENVSGITTELSQLLTIVRSISSHTHNKAINSIIAADRQGEKAGAMKLLAQEMNGLASQSDVFTREVEGIILSIVSQAGEIGRNEKGRSSGSDGAGGAILRLNDVLQDISLGYDSFRQDSLAAFERAGGLKKAIDATFAGLDFFKGLSEKIDDYGRQLTDIADRSGMERVRVSVDPAVDGTRPSEPASDRQDNIILFESVRKTVDRAAANGDVDHSLGDNVELF